jgi:hypothetical protein
VKWLKSPLPQIVSPDSRLRKYENYFVIWFNWDQLDMSMLDSATLSECSRQIIAMIIDNLAAGDTQENRTGHAFSLY